MFGHNTGYFFLSLVAISLLSRKLLGKGRFLQNPEIRKNPEKSQTWITQEINHKGIPLLILKSLYLYKFACVHLLSEVASFKVVVKCHIMCGSNYVLNQISIFPCVGCCLWFLSLLLCLKNSAYNLLLFNEKSPDDPAVKQEQNYKWTDLVIN